MNQRAAKPQRTASIAQQLLTKTCALPKMSPMTNASDEITTREACAVLGVAHPSSVTRLVEMGRLTPIRKFPGKTGAYLFDRAEVAALANERRGAA